MRLGPIELLGREAVGLQAVVDITVEGHDGLARVFGGELGRPGLVARHIQRCELVADVHQAGDLLGRFFAQHVNQGLGLGDELRLRVWQACGQGGLVIQRFGG
ncbi:hypothetical protein D3C72_2026080 [compost metagenome]